MSNPKKRLLADVLWEAANERLFDGNGAFRGYSEFPTSYSCNAIAHAMGKMDCDYLPAKVIAFLRSLGCEPTSGCSMYAMNIKSGVEAQSVRYMWLLLAMHVAEDEGITC